MGYHKHVSIYFITFIQQKDLNPKNYEQILKTELKTYIGEHLNWQRKCLKLGNFRRKHLKNSSQHLSNYIFHVVTLLRCGMLEWHMEVGDM